MSLVEDCCRLVARASARARFARSGGGCVDGGAIEMHAKVAVAVCRSAYVLLAPERFFEQSASVDNGRRGD
eukprot:11158453-Lingulodinium_polyedra.AAC.1